VHAASIAAPYRHPRLSAVKHVDGLGQPGSIDGILGLTPRSPKQCSVTTARRERAPIWMGKTMKSIAMVCRATVYEAMALAVFAGIIVLFVHAMLPLIATD
jgi:hypothetical protein